VAMAPVVIRGVCRNGRQDDTKFDLAHGGARFEIQYCAYYAAKPPASRKAVTSIGGLIRRRSALASASRIQRQKSHSLSLVTTSVFPPKTASPRFRIRPAGHGGGPGVSRTPGPHPPDPAAGPTFSARDVRTFHYSGNRHGLRDQFLEGADNSEAARIRLYMARVSGRRRLLSVFFAFSAVLSSAQAAPSEARATPAIISVRISFPFLDGPRPFDPMWRGGTWSA
jgi:hypothetical protein